MGLYDIYKAQLLSSNSGGSGGDTATLDALIDRSITEISSSATSIGAYAFYECSKLTTVDLPSATSVGKYAFYGCSKLTTVDLPSATSIADCAFHGCSKLTTLILRSSSMCNLSSTNSFQGSAIAYKTGYIYVPSALIEFYKTVANWSTYATQFRALEDYTVDGTTTGALDETKI